MPDPRLDAGPPALPTAETGLLAWNGVGTVVAAIAVGIVGYVGFTGAQLVGMVTDDSTSTVAVADPPPYDAYPVAARADEPEPATPSRGSDRPKPAPSKSPSPEPKPATKAPAGKSTADTFVASRRIPIEIRRAHWADRQLATMLRQMPVSTPWFSGASWVLPVSGYHLTARFGESGNLWSSTHTGLDLAAPTGTPVRAVTSGTVTFAGTAGAYGNKIELTHPDGSETWYSHLSQINVSVGTPVGTGALIGAVGATGNVTGPHLHLEVRSDHDTPVDPYDALVQHGLQP